MPLRQAWKVAVSAGLTDMDLRILGMSELLDLLAILQAANGMALHNLIFSSRFWHVETELTLRLQTFCHQVSKLQELFASRG